MTSTHTDCALPPIPAPSCDWRALTWYAVTTLPRCEGRATAGLIEAGYTAFLPIRREWVPHRRTGPLARTWRQVERPLWVGYILVGMAPGQGWLSIRKTDGVRGPVSIEGVPLSLSAARVCDVYARCVEGEWDVDRRPKRRRYTAGERIRIQDGSLAGRIAVVRRTTSEDPRTVLAELLEGGAKISVPVDAVKLVVAGVDGDLTTAAG